MGSDICNLKGLDAQKPECYVKNSEKKLFLAKLTQSSLFDIFQNLVFVINFNAFRFLWVIKDSGL